MKIVECEIAEKMLANLRTRRRFFSSKMQLRCASWFPHVTAVPVLNTSLISDTPPEPPLLIRNLESNDADEIIVTSPAFPRGVTFERSSSSLSRHISPVFTRLHLSSSMRFSDAMHSLAYPRYLVFRAE